MDNYFNEERLDNWENVSMLRGIFRALCKLRIMSVGEYLDLDDVLPYYFDSDLEMLDDGPRYEDVETEEELTQERYDKLLNRELKRRRNLSRKESPKGRYG